jgi:hypothetical protein
VQFRNYRFSTIIRVAAHDFYVTSVAASYRSAIDS